MYGDGSYIKKNTPRVKDIMKVHVWMFDIDNSMTTSLLLHTIVSSAVHFFLQLFLVM